MKFKERLSVDAWHDLEDRVNRRRRGSKVVDVPVEAIIALLYDHGDLLREYHADKADEKKIPKPVEQS